MYADAMQLLASGLSAMLTTGFAGMLLSVIFGAAKSDLKTILLKMINKEKACMSSKQSFEAVLVKQCAPTLARVKPANLFRFQFFADGAIQQTVMEWDRKLSPYGISVCIVKQCFKTGSFLICTYRRAWINKILSEQCNQDFLESMGYTLSGGHDSILRQLSQRFCQKQFPHEIGLFLGYPLEDVVGFIENQGRNFTCVGYWKSYGDPASAQICYERYRKCTKIYSRMFGNGTPIMRLVVAA